MTLLTLQIFGFELLNTVSCGIL